MGVCTCSCADKMIRADSTHQLSAKIKFIKKQDIYQHYRVVQVLGQGGFSTVKLGYKINKGPDPQNYIAIKSIMKSQLDDISQLKNEIDILSRADHPNIINFHEIYEDSKHFHIVMEYCRGGDLFDRIIQTKDISEAKIAGIMQQVLSALSFLHSNNFSHRDIKAENILFLNEDQDSQIKLIDFGLAQKFKKTNDKFHSFVGTSYYVAPEVIQGIYDSSCDIWSCGVLLYIMLSGTPPFTGRTDDEIFDSIMQGHYNFKENQWQNVSDYAKDLITKMLVIQPQKRIKLKQAMKHKWFQQIMQQSTNAPITLDIVKQLKRLKAPKRLQKEALKVMIKYLNQEDIGVIRVIFNQRSFMSIDKNNTGYLTAEELGQALLRSNMVQAKEEIDQIVNRIKYLNKGKLKWSDFIMATYGLQQLLREDLIKAAFDQFDNQNIGRLSKNDLLAAFEAGGGTPMPKEELDQVINDFSNIDFDQFQSLMKGIALEATPSIAQFSANAFEELKENTQ